MAATSGRLADCISGRSLSGSGPADGIVRWPRTRPTPPPALPPSLHPGVHPLGEYPKLFHHTPLQNRTLALPTRARVLLIWSGTCHSPEAMFCQSMWEAVPVPSAPPSRCPADDKQAPGGLELRLHAALAPTSTIMLDSCCKTGIRSAPGLGAILGSEKAILASNLLPSTSKVVSLTQVPPPNEAPPRRW